MTGLLGAGDRRRMGGGQVFAVQADDQLDTELPDVQVVHLAGASEGELDGLKELVLRKAFDDASVKSVLAKQGADPMIMDPKAFDQFLHAEVKTNAKIVEAAWTGRKGDGVLFSAPVQGFARIRELGASKREGSA